MYGQAAGTGEGDGGVGPDELITGPLYRPPAPGILCVRLVVDDLLYL